jgi:hypothetical protein
MGGELNPDRKSPENLARMTVSHLHVLLSGYFRHIWIGVPIAQREMTADFRHIFSSPEGPGTPGGKYYLNVFHRHKFGPEMRQ